MILVQFCTSGILNLFFLVNVPGSFGATASISWLSFSICEFSYTWISNMGWNFGSCEQFINWSHAIWRPIRFSWSWRFVQIVCISLCTVAKKTMKQSIHIYLSEKSLKIILIKCTFPLLLWHANITDSADIGSKGTATISDCSNSGFGSSPRAPADSELTRQGNQGSIHHGNLWSMFIFNFDDLVYVKCTMISCLSFSPFRLQIGKVVLNVWVKQLCFLLVGTLAWSH